MEIVWDDVETQKTKVGVRTVGVAYGGRSGHRLGWSIFAQQPDQLKSFQALHRGSYS
jgi:hypothetical protein